MHFLTNEHYFITEIALSSNPKQWSLRQIKDDLFALTIHKDIQSFHLDIANEILNELKGKNMFFEGQFMMDEVQESEYLNYLSGRDRAHSYFPLVFIKGIIDIELVHEFSKKSIIPSMIVDCSYIPMVNCRWIV